MNWDDLRYVLAVGRHGTFAAAGRSLAVDATTLVARQHVWNWPLGLLNNVFWALRFWRATLYSGSSLPGVFFVLGCYGWWRWRAGAHGAVLAVIRTRALEWKVPTGLVVIATAALAAWLARATDSPAPLAVATVLTPSLAATWGQAETRIESWWIWIAVDVVRVPLHVSRALYPTAGLHVMFGVPCVLGRRSWTRERRAAEAAA